MPGGRFKRDCSGEVRGEGLLSSDKGLQWCWRGEVWFHLKLPETTWLNSFGSGVWGYIGPKTVLGSSGEGLVLRGGPEESRIKPPS